MNTHENQMNRLPHDIKDSYFYESMEEYANGADISHYRQSTTEKNPPPVITVPFYVGKDSDVNIDHTDTEKLYNCYYTRICWGEIERSYIRTHRIWDVSYIRYEYNGAEYVSDGTVYATNVAALEGK